MRTRRFGTHTAILLTVSLMVGCSDSNETLAPPTGDAACTEVGTGRFRECNNGGNGTVFDTYTNLIWLKAADCLERKTLANARTAVADLADGQCGLLDSSSEGAWRLPTKAEWEAILKLSCPVGTVQLPNTEDDDNLGNGCWSEGNPFTGVTVGSYWSSTAGDNIGFTWIVYLSDGYFIPDDDDDANHVWAVRSN